MSGVNVCGRCCHYESEHRMTMGTQSVIEQRPFFCRAPGCTCRIGYSEQGLIHLTNRQYDALSPEQDASYRGLLCDDTAAALVVVREQLTQASQGVQAVRDNLSRFIVRADPSPTDVAANKAFTLAIGYLDLVLADLAPTPVREGE